MLVITVRTAKGWHIYGMSKAIEIPIQRREPFFFDDGHPEVDDIRRPSPNDEKVVLFFEVTMRDPRLVKGFDQVQKGIEEGVAMRNLRPPNRDAVDAFENQIASIEKAVTTGDAVHFRQSGIDPVLVPQHGPANKASHAPPHGCLEDKMLSLALVEIDVSLIPAAENVRPRLDAPPDPLKELVFGKVVQPAD